MTSHEKLKDLCIECGTPVPLSACQQPVLFEGTIKPCHLYCNTLWFHREIPVWTIEHDGSSYCERSLGTISEMLDAMDCGTAYTITKKKMKQGEYHALPEFRGF